MERQLAKLPHYQVDHYFHTCVIYSDRPGRPATDYLLCLDMAKEIAMMAATKWGQPIPKMREWEPNRYVVRRSVWSTLLEKNLLPFQYLVQFHYVYRVNTIEFTKKELRVLDLLYAWPPPGASDWKRIEC